MKHVDTEWMWWKGPPVMPPDLQLRIGSKVVWRGQSGIIRDVVRNAVLVEWDGSPPSEGPTEPGGIKGKSK